MTPEKLYNNEGEEETLQSGNNDGVKEIPSNVQITTLLDKINPDSVSGVFNDTHT